MSVAGEVGEAGDEREGFVVGLVPVADVAGRLAGLGVGVGDRGALHAGSEHDAEVGAGLGHGRPGIAADRAEHDGVGVADVVEAEVAGEAELGALGVELGQAGERGDDLQIHKAGEVLVAEILLAVRVDGGEGETRGAAADVVGEGDGAAGEVFKQVEAGIGGNDPGVHVGAEERGPERRGGRGVRGGGGGARRVEANGREPDDGDECEGVGDEEGRCEETAREAVRGGKSGQIFGSAGQDADGDGAVVLEVVLEVPGGRLL